MPYVALTYGEHYMRFSIVASSSTIRSLRCAPPTVTCISPSWAQLRRFMRDDDLAAKVRCCLDHLFLSVNNEVCLEFYLLCYTIILFVVRS